MSTIHSKLLSKCPQSSKSLHNLERYVKFIEQCKASNVASSGLEDHHICPKAQSLFPEYTNLRKHKWNSALLTPRQHLIAHWMLARVYGGAMSSALWYMSNNPGSYVSSRMYAESRKTFAVDQSKRSKEMWLNPEYRAMMTDMRTNLWLDEDVRDTSIQLMKDAWTDQRHAEHKVRASAHMQELNNNPDFVSTRNDASSKAMKARHSDPEFCAKRDKRAVETITKLNASFRHCTHCDKSFKLGNYAMWHGDKCKKKL